MDGETPLLKAKLESLAKLCAKQPHALELRDYFDTCFSEERLIVNAKKVTKVTSVTELIQARITPSSPETSR